MLRRFFEELVFAPMGGCFILTAQDVSIGIIFLKETLCVGLGMNNTQRHTKNPMENIQDVWNVLLS